MRPTLHFTPRTGWINDPHGITARDGGYDVFFQYVPGRTEWAPECHWGHARGADLLDLRERTVAIAPGDGEDGVWTGCVVRDDRDARAFYTATTTPDFGIGRVRTARSADADWDRWTKGETVVVAPDGLDLIAFRDPFVTRDGDGWRMYVGAAGADGMAMALGYTSHDLESWTYDGIALSRPTSETEPVWMGALWECPQIFELDGVAVMVSSVWDADVLHYAGYAVGSLEEGRFIPRRWGRLTWGDSLYAPSLFLDAEGRHCLTFWLRGIRGEDWAGAHSIPFVLRVVDDALIATPHPDVSAHRLPPVGDGRVPALAADIRWRPSDGTVELRSGEEVVSVLTRVATELTVRADGAEASVPAAGTVRVIVDGPVLEVVSEAGLYAAAIAPSGPTLDVVVSGGAVAEVHPLQ